MQAFFLSLKSEFLKTRKTLGFWSAILLPLVICGLVFAAVYFKHQGLINKPPLVIWMQYSMASLGVMGVLLLPMFVIFTCYSVNSIEHRADTWKSLFSLPIPKLTTYSAKYFYTVFLVALCLTLFASFTLLSGNLLGVLVPELKFNDYSFIRLLSSVYFKLFLSSLGILSIQFALSLLWADFLKPMGIGFCVFVVAMIASINNWEHAWKIPYAHPMMVISNLKPSNAGPGKELSIDLLTKEIYLSLAISAVMFVVGYFVISRRSVK
ncbi:ABC transporter permease [Hufsiella ginkgonis]|uniref:ABC transporter permease subunit n=1 Tax=Hufsiella ginkgonis TaxID=2695274 RepID=A0A7K1Y2N4_9SPHI|nr:ABC transporter permease [Hufsiella ginkgonis]MXV17543.1 ABC transporter permease subunit [Hufsiella ginkgonis]